MLRRSSRMFLLLAAASTFAFAADPGLEPLAEAGHWKRVRDLAQARRASNPKDAEAAYRLSQVKAAFGDLPGALKLAETAVRLEPGNSEHHSQIADICAAMTDHAGSLKALGLARRIRKELEAALELDPQSTDARRGLMEFHAQAPAIAGGDRKQVGAQADAIARIDVVEGHLARARLAEMEKNAAAQEEAYRRALAADPKSYKVRVLLAAFYSADPRKDFGRAETEAKEALKIDPTRAAPYTILAQVYAAAGRSKDLDAILARAEKKVPDDFSPAYQAGKALLLGGEDYPRAERCFRKYLTQEPEGGQPPLAAARWRLGQVLEKEGRKAEAIRELETAVRLDPSLTGAKDDLKRLKP